ncbi:unnamed protein product [Nezara viridula]|uniref:C2H2-type domain-containing protein n=1 Tax=Nezara viridula TaxID=85310 RepID=A0A9P0MJL5_NEZVI|nr:unnamed protein product [Nezara viridula]
MDIEVDSDRRTNDLKKYNGVINKASRKSSAVRLSPPVFPAKNTDSIDCTQVSDRSGIQYDSDIIKINEGSLDIIDIDTSVTKKVLNDGMKLNDQKKRRRSNPQYVTEKHCMKDNEKKNFPLFQKRNHENWPTPLQAFANEMMKENKNISTVPVQIKVDNKDWTVNVSTTVVSQSKSSSEFPRNREALFKSLKEESYRLLKLVSKKNSIRNDVRMVFDPNENRITPFHINFKKGDSNNDKSPDNLDMTKFLSSDVEDSDDGVSNSDMSECDGQDSIGSPGSPSNLEYSGAEVHNGAHKLIDGSIGVNNTALHLTLNQCDTNVEEIEDEMLCSNEQVPITCGQDAMNEIDPLNEFKNELNHDVLNEGPSQIVGFSKSHDHQNLNDFLEKEVNQNTLNGRTDILCLSDINHLGKEVKVKSELDQQVLPKKVIDEETGSVVHIEVFGIKENGRQAVIAKSEEGVETANQFESEYIIPDIDFVDSSGIKCSNERINVSDSFQADISNSSYDFESDTGVNVTEDEVSGMHSNDTSQDVSEEYAKPNEELVLLDNDLPTSSLQGTVSDVKGEKDPLSIDEFTGGVLFYDPETDYDNRDLYSSENNGSCSNENNIHLCDNENGISDNTQESNEENTDDFSLSNKWNWSNLKKYNSKTTQNDLTKMRHKPSKEDEKFIGFSDCTDSSSKYSDFVSACSKLGYYDDMVILNQHYEIIPPNKKGKSFLHSESLGHGLSKEVLTAAKGSEENGNAVLAKKKISEVKTSRTQEVILVKSEIITNHKSGNDSEAIFLGFKSNDNYTEFRRKSIEISRRLSEEFSDGKNKIDHNLITTAENISCFLVAENGKDNESSFEEDNVSKYKVSSNDKKLINQSLEQENSLILNKNSKLSKLTIDSMKVGDEEKNKSGSTESVPKKRGRPRKNQFKTTDIVSDTLNRKENTDSALEESNLSENDDKLVINQLPNHSDKEANQAALMVDTEDETENNIVLLKSPPSNLTNLVQCMNDGQANDTDDSCIEVKEMFHQSADEASLIPNGNPLTCTLDTGLNELDSKENSLESVLKKGDGCKINQSQLVVTSSSTDQLNANARLIEDNSDTAVKELKPLENEDTKIVNDLPISAGQGSTSISITNSDHEIVDENLQYKDQVEDTSQHFVDHVSLIPLENKENILSTPVISVSRKRGRPKKNHSETITSIPTIQCNGTLEVKEENTEDVESYQFENDDELVLHDPPESAVEKPISTTSNDINVSSKSSTSKLTTFTQCMNNTQGDSYSSYNDIKDLRHVSNQSSLSVPNESCFETKVNTLIASNESVPKKRGRPRKNPIHLIASTPTKPSSTVYLNGENSNTDKEEFNLFNNDESFIKSTAEEHNLTENSFVSENNKITIDSVTNEEPSSVLKQDLENRPEKKLKIETTLDAIPLKRKPGRPPKRLSSCFQNSNQLKKKSNDILDSSLAISVYGNESLFNLSASLESEKLSCSGQKNVCDKPGDLLLENGSILENPLKRKPGRPPKCLSLCLQGSKQPSQKSNSTFDSSLATSESENINLLNSSATLESESLSVSERKGVDKSNDLLLLEKKDILEIPLKRKPGRPPKRSSICFQGPNELQKEGCKNFSLVINESGSNSLILNSSATLGAGPVSFSEQNNVEDKPRDLVEMADILETSTKRKPGRPPKRSLEDKGEIDQGHKEINCVPAMKSERNKNGSLISNSFSKEDSSGINSQIEIETNLILDEHLQIEKNQPDKELTSISTHNEPGNVNVGVSEKQIEMNNKTFSDPTLKRKPDSPPKRLSVSANDQEFILDQKENDEIHNSCPLSNGVVEHNTFVLNSPISSDQFPLFCHAENEKINSEPQVDVTIKNRLILELPQKRKPGRPPKNSYLHSEEIKQGPIEGKYADNKDSTLDNNDSINNSLGSIFSNEAKEIVEYKLEDKLLMNQKDSLKPLLKRKPGRPPKCLSVCQQKTQCPIENKNSGVSTNDMDLDSLSNTEFSSPEGDNKNLEDGEKDSLELVIEKKDDQPPNPFCTRREEMEVCQTSNKNVSVKDNDSSTKNFLNLFSFKEDFSNVSKTKYAKHELEDDEKNIVEPPFKRKPGRPSKRSMSQQEIGKYPFGIINVENTLVKDMDRSLNSSLLNSSSNVDSLSDIAHAKEGINQLRDEEKNSFELPPKRKPGRPPKRLSIGHHEAEKCHIESKNIEDIPMSDNKTSLNSCILNSNPNEDGLCNVTHSEDIKNNMVVEKKVSIETPLKRKPGRPPKHLSIGQQNINPAQNKNNLNQNVLIVTSSVTDYSEPPPKRKPGRPRKVSLEFKNIEENSRNNSVHNLDHTVVKIEDERLFIAENNSFTVFPSQDKNETPVESSQCLPKRKPGRPRKNSLPIGEESSDISKKSLESSVNSESTPKRRPEDGCDNNVNETDESLETNYLNDNDLTYKQMARIEKRKLLSGRVDSSTRLKNPNDKVKCALCGEVMNVIHYQKEHLLKHNFMSWLEGEEPLPLDDFDKMDTLLLRGKRANPNFVFRCEVCHQEKKSSKGLLSHRQFCGKSDEERVGMMVSCPYCGRLMMPVSLQPHIYQSHRTANDPPPPEESSDPGPGSVRKAAAKCLGKIASIIEENGLAKSEEDFNADGDEEFDEIEEISLLYIPVQKKKINKHLMNRWKHLARDKKELHCIVPSCTFKAMLIKDIVQHHRLCTADRSQGFSCIKCNYICKVEDEMREHVKSCNPPIMVSQSDNSEDEDHEKHVIIPYLKAAEQNSTGRHKAMFFKPALTWMNEIYKKYFTQEPLYPDLHLNIDLWKEMDPLTSQFYNPEKSNSMMVSFQNSTWESMHALEGKVIEGNQGIAYTGGPVWGLEWCPGEGPQYLAVSSHLSMEFNFQAGSTFTGPGLVQLWSLEDISNAKSDTLSTLQFCYGVCHNDRACWNMAWCPSGGRTDTRIGLLALATTSGSIPIYAMPNPECLQYQSTRFYKPEPVLKLELWSNERWQCSAISWSKIKPHNIIAAGFVNGVCLSPESDKYLATASYDKSFKYWDLIDTTAPHTVLKQIFKPRLPINEFGFLMQSVAVNDWLNGAITSYDNGQVVLFLALRQTTYQHLDKRKFSKVILNSTLHNIEAKDGSVEPNSKQKEKEIHNNMPSNSYGDAIHKYGLSIKTVSCI